jgi:hypothetical protein
LVFQSQSTKDSGVGIKNKQAGIETEAIWSAFFLLAWEADVDQPR